jgi:hypothetical protein
VCPREVNETLRKPERRTQGVSSTIATTRAHPALAPDGFEYGRLSIRAQFGAALAEDRA